MINEISYTSIKEVLSSLQDHPLLSDITIDKVIRYTITFISKMGCPKLYQDKKTVIPIKEWRGELPCDLISIIQVRDTNSGICLRSMTDTFGPDTNGVADADLRQEPTFKTQGRVLYTSFKEGDVEIAYKAIPIDEDGFPLLIDNPVFMDALEAYIKKKEFTVLFDLGKINQNALENAKQEYAWAAGQCQSEFTIPSVSEMQSISNMWCSLIPRNYKFYDGFKNLGSPNNLKVH